MSNILIIKHGSLGDIAQASGAIQDIFENHKEDDLYILSTKPYYELLRKNPFIKDIIIDKRKSRFNLIYLYFLMRKIKNHKFSKIYDLQNSSRSKFYKKILHPHSGPEIWSSSITTLPKEKTKEEFDKEPVLYRFNYQLNKSGLVTKNVLKPNFEWSCEDISDIKNNYKLEKYIILFPFSSAHLTIKRWPFYNELIKKIKEKFENKYQLVVAPGPNEIKIANEIDAKIILNNERALNISQLSALIKDSSFVVANDTGPAHMAAHLNAKGLVLFGSHTTAKKVSIERKNFKAIQVSDLTKLSADRVFQRMQEAIN
jgi:ADP-heptose:LPS heptosyltransferase